MDGVECDAFSAETSDGACLRLSLEKAGAAARRTARWRAPVGSVNMLPRDRPGRLQMTFKRSYLRREGGGPGWSREMLQARMSLLDIIKCDPCSHPDDLCLRCGERNVAAHPVKEGWGCGVPLNCRGPLRGLHPPCWSVSGVSLVRNWCRGLPQGAGKIPRRFPLA